MNIAVLGAGAWGTAMAISLARHPVVPAAARQATLWDVTRPGVQHYRPTVRMNAICPAILFAVGHGDWTSLVQADMVSWATLLAGLRPTVRQLHALRPGSRRFCGCARGWRLAAVCCRIRWWRMKPAVRPPCMVRRPGQVLPRRWRAACRRPSHWPAGMRALPVTWRSSCPGRACGFMPMMICRGEVGGAVKNVLAIASGICDGLGLGHNARAALLTRGLARRWWGRFGLALGARRETLMGLAGMGDLILTCTAIFPATGVSGWHWRRGVRCRRSWRPWGMWPNACQRRGKWRGELRCWGWICPSCGRCAACSMDVCRLPMRSFSPCCAIPVMSEDERGSVDRGRAQAAPTKSNWRQAS